MKLLTLSVSACLLFLVSAATLSGLNPVKKRSDEVIFFEKESPGADSLAKRSEWNDEKNIKNQLGNRYSALKEDALASKTKPKSKSPDVDPKVLEEIEQDAFYDALDFLVEKLVDSAYDEDMTTAEYSFEELDKSSSKNNKNNDNKIMENNLKNAEDMFEGNSVNDDTIVEQTTAASTAAIPEQDDMEEDELQSLVEEKKSTSVIEETVKTTPEVEETVEPIAETTSLPKYEDMYKYMASADETGQDSQDLEEMLEYMEYLDTLKLLEGKLKNRLSQSKTDYKDDNSEKSKTRVRRSLMEGEMSEFELNGKLDEENLNGKEGVYFTAQEAQELRDLLIQLAKERMESEELIKFLVDSLKDVYGDDVVETDYLSGQKGKSSNDEEYDMKLSQFDDYNDFNPEYRSYQKSPYNTNSKSALLESLAQGLRTNQDRWKK